MDSIVHSKSTNSSKFKEVTCYLRNDLPFLSQTLQRCIVVAHNSHYAYKNHNSQGS